MRVSVFSHLSVFAIFVGEISSATRVKGLPDVRNTHSLKDKPFIIKHHYMIRFIVLLCSLALLSEAKAQMLPSGSSESRPIWYYIENAGGASESPLVCTVEDDQVYSREKQLSDGDAAASQLWRFETDDEGLCYIINKATGRYMNFKFSSTSRTNVVCVADNRAKFMFVLHDKGISLRLNSATDEQCYVGFGTREEVKGQLVGVTGEESLTDGFLKFTAYNDSPLKYSTKGHETWYGILSAKEGLDGMALTDCSSENTDFPVTVSSFNSDDAAQQWKLVKDESTGRMRIVNRKSGLHILTASSVVGSFNATVLGWVAKNPGFDHTYLGLGQYALYGTEDDGVIRYLALQDTESAPVELKTDKLASSAFAWQFKETGTGTGITDLSDDIKISVADGRIVVSGTDNYKITSAQGMQMPKEARLQKGVYIVTCNGRSVKITINK